MILDYPCPQHVDKKVGEQEFTTGEFWAYCCFYRKVGYSQREMKMVAMKMKVWGIIVSRNGNRLYMLRNNESAMENKFMGQI